MTEPLKIGVRRPARPRTASAAIVAGEGEVRYANDGKLYGFGAEA